MKTRIITSILLCIILIPVVIVPQLVTVFEMLVILFTILASIEVLNMFDKQKKMPLGIKILSVIMTLALYSSIIDSFAICSNTLVVRILNLVGFRLSMYLTLAIIFLCLISCMIFVHDFDASDVGKCFTEVLYIGISFASFTILRSYGIRFIIYLLMITVATDVFALVFGINFGKHKMAPTISPKKSWEGAIGGTAVALVIGFLFLLFYPYMAPAFHDGNNLNFFAGVFEYEFFSKAGLVIFMILLTLCMSICSQIGDLVASKMKRTYGIKDFSNIFPGHGGVLDRFDSALFTSTIFLVFLQVGTIVFPVLLGAI